MQDSAGKRRLQQPEIDGLVRPATTAMLSMLFGLWSGIMVITGGLMVLGESYFGLSGWLVMGMGSIVFFMGLFGFLVAWGLWNQMGWARWTAALCAGIGLIGIPIGTVLSLLVLWYLLRPGKKRSFVE
jgi:hypothetical protein